MHTLSPTTLALLALLALLPNTITAFFPYPERHDSSTTPSSSSSAPLPPSAPLPLTLPLHRLNTYPITTSTPPTHPHSAAIDQDGRDLSYMVSVKFGSSTQEYHLLLDSAASATWVMGRACGDEACAGHGLFGEGDSESLVPSKTPFDISYGTGSVSGLLATDTLHIAGLSPRLSFGLATTVSQDFLSYPMDGILGLGRASSTDTATSLLAALVSANLIPSKLYGVHLNRLLDGAPSSSSSPSAAKSPDGEITFGSINTARFTSNLTYTSLLSSSSSSSNDNNNNPEYWEIPIEAASLDGTAIVFPAPYAASSRRQRPRSQPLQHRQPGSDRSAILDTGTSFLLLPPADALALHALIPNMQQQGEAFYIPCDALPVLSLTFSGVSYTVSPADWRGSPVGATGTDGRARCKSNILARQTFGPSQWLVGAVFLKNVYAVFDAERGRVGLGTLDSGSAGSGSGSSGVKDGESATATTAGSSATGGSAPAGGGSSRGEAASRSSVPFGLVLAVMGVGWVGQ